MAQDRSSSGQPGPSAEHPGDHPAYGEPDVRPGRWLPLGQAAKALGLSRAGVYRRIRTGAILSKPRGNRGLEVFVPDERERPPERSASGDADVRADDAAELVTELREKLADLRHTLGRAEGKVEVLQTALDREIAITAELRRELAEARRPWLAKVLEGLRRRGS